MWTEESVCWTVWHSMNNLCPNRGPRNGVETPTGRNLCRVQLVNYEGFVRKRTFSNLMTATQLCHFRWLWWALKSLFHKNQSDLWKPFATFVFVIYFLKMSITIKIATLWYYEEVQMFLCFWLTTEFRWYSLVVPNLFSLKLSFLNSKPIRAPQSLATPNLSKRHAQMLSLD